MSTGTNGDEDDGFIVRVRGLPWSATAEEIASFFSDCNLSGSENVHLTLSREGRPSGEAYLELSNEEDMKTAMSKHNEHMGHRYIEVFKSKRSEMDWVIKRSSLQQEETSSDGCVRLRGLPFGCTKEEIAQFFSGMEIVPNGITLPIDCQGRSTGEAYVEFSSADIAEKALGKHKEKIGHRYIEIFKSSLQEVKGASGFGGQRMRGANRPGPYDRQDRFGGGGGGGPMGGRYNRGPRNFRGGYDDLSDFDGWSRNGRRSFIGQGGGMGGGGGGGGNMRPPGHCVHMRGLPFRASEQDVQEFFRPLVPVNVRLIYEDSGRAKGEADVEFGTHEEAVKAMSKDKAHMQHRYIELFLNSTPESASGFGGMNAGSGGFGSGGMGNGFSGGGYGDSMRSGGNMPNMGSGGGGYFGNGMGGPAGGGGMFSGPNYSSF